jgi:hypothetical protein
MNDELTDAEKIKIAAEALVYLRPIFEKYELNYPLGRQALLEAFQAGIRFTIQQTNKEHDDGRAKA